MTRTRVVIAAALLALALTLALAARPHEASADERVDRITAELRCPVCQGLSVKDSPSDTARQMRDLVVQRVGEGKTDAQIEDEFRAAYGDWILLAPPRRGFSLIVWIFPFVAVVVGLGIVALVLRRWTRRPRPSTAKPIDADMSERIRREIEA